MEQEQNMKEKNALLNESRGRPRRDFKEYICLFTQIVLSKWETKHEGEIIVKSDLSEEDLSLYSFNSND